MPLRASQGDTASSAQGVLVRGNEDRLQGVRAERELPKIHQALVQELESTENDIKQGLDYIEQERAAIAAIRERGREAEEALEVMESIAS